jgi:conjugative relaxase-like TrwC/TraI family protein
MLSIAKMAAGQERYYLELGREDYYLHGGEPPGRWYGRAASALGLDGEVTVNELHALMHGRSPTDDSRLGQVQHYRDGRTHQVGWDLTFSAPKSVSILWSQAPEDLRQAIQAAHGEAVKTALAYLEETAAFTRRGHGGANFERSDLAIAVFEHGSSRALDPQLHTHCLTLAATRRGDGTWGRLYSRPLFQHKMAAGALYRLALGSRLRELGLNLRAEGAWFEIEGVPKELLAHFSKRRAAIEALMSELGVSGPRVAEKLALTSRQVKGHVARGELLTRWREAGRALDFGPEAAERLLRNHALAKSELAPKVVLGALKELGESNTTFRERDLLRRVAEQVQAEGVAPTALLSQVRRFLHDSPEVISLGVGEGHQALYTERSLFEAEAELLRSAEVLHARSRHAARSSPIAKGGVQLNEEQQAALRHITAAGDLKLLTGLAGTGKTRLLDAARSSFEAAGYKVLGAALTGRAAHELAEGAGIRSSTAESLLYRLEPSLRRTLSHHARMLLREAAGMTTWKLPRPILDERTVLVLDEASMIGSRHLARILHSAERAKTKLVLVGDAKQLQAIEPGGGFAGLIQRFGAARLTNIVRQRDDWMRRAVHEFADGDARGALSRFAHHGRLHVEGTRDEAMRALLTAWSHERTPRLSDTLILAGTNAEVDELNRRAQVMRASELGGGLRHGPWTYREGDRVVFATAWRPLGVLNGDFGTIERVRGRRMSILLDRERLGGGALRVVVSDKELTVNAFGEDRDLLRLGYASTVHKAQGATVEHTFVLAGGWMEHREAAYVAMSRARGHARIFSDETSAGEDLTELVRIMTRSQEQVMAHDQQQRLRIRPF